MLREASTAKLREAVARDPQHSHALNELAIELHDQGKYIQAEPLFRRCLELRKAKYGDTPHEAVSVSLNNLAGVLQALEHFEEAKVLYKQALDMFKKLFGEEHSQVSMDAD